MKKTIIILVVVILIILGAVFLGRSGEMADNGGDKYVANDKSGMVAQTGTSGLKDDETRAPELQFFSPIGLRDEMRHMNMAEMMDIEGEVCAAKFTLSRWEDGSYHMDGGTMRLNIGDKKVTGSSTFAIAGKDAWRYKYEGVESGFDHAAMTHTLDLTAEGMSEGMAQPKVKTQMVLGPTKISVSGEPGKLLESLDVIDCDELTEWEGVQAELGKAESYPDYFVLNYQNNSGFEMTSYFADKDGKFTPQRKDFTYTTDAKHKVTGLKMK